MRNTDIETGWGEDQGLLQVTMCSPSEWRSYSKYEGAAPQRTALFTARGKDHQMTADQLEKLGKTCLQYAKRIRENK
jgi:hypothetical protein